MKNFLAKFFLFRKRIVFRIFMYYIIPVICSMLAMCILYFYYNDYFKKETETNYLGVLQNLSKSIDDTYSEIYLTANMIPIDRSILNIICTDNSAKSADYADYSSCVSTLRLIRSTKNCIDNVFFIDKENNIIIASGGTESIDLFFNRSNRFTSYPEEFWVIPTQKNFQILKPTVLSNANNGMSKTVIPIIQKRIGDYVSRKPFVTTLDQGYFNNLLYEQKFTPNSKLFITNIDGDIFSCSETMQADFSQWFRSIILADVTSSTSSIITAKFKNVDMIVILHHTKVLGNDFIYSACIPLSDLYTKTSYMKQLSLCTMAIMLILSIIFSSMIAIHLFNPIKKLAEIMRNSSTHEDNLIQANEIDYIGNSLNRIIKTSENLKNELSKTASILKEQFLLKILNNDDSIQIDTLELTLQNLGIKFQHKFFCVSIIQLAFSEDFKKHYCKEEQHSIHEKMLKLLSDILQKVCPVQFVQAENWKTIIISNVPEDINSNLISDQFDKFVGLFSYDILYLHTSIGIGSTYPGFFGMEMSYREAKLALTQLPKFAYKSIKIYDEIYDDKGYILSYNDESKIFNYLMSSKTDKANEMINLVIAANVKKNINEENLKELYSQIYQIGRKVLKHKGKEPTVCLKGDQLNVLDSYRQMDLHLIAETLNTFLQNILSLCDKNGYKVNVQSIMEFIECNYSEDLYVEKLADKFNISSTHLSRILKEALSMSFQKYLSYIRIVHAKEFLTTTSKSVQDISVLVGYNNRNTFIRSFEMLEGVTPSDYRKNMSS